MKHIAIFQLKDHFGDYPETNRSGMPLIIDSMSSLMPIAGHLKLFNNPTIQLKQIKPSMLNSYILDGPAKSCTTNFGWLKAYKQWDLYHLSTATFRIHHLSPHRPPVAGGRFGGGAGSWAANHLPTRKFGWSWLVMVRQGASR